MTWLTTCHGHLSCTLTHQQHPLATVRTRAGVRRRGSAGLCRRRSAPPTARGRRSPAPHPRVLARFERTRRRRARTKPKQINKIRRTGSRRGAAYRRSVVSAAVRVDVGLKVVHSRVDHRLDRCLERDAIAGPPHLRARVCEARARARARVRGRAHREAVLRGVLMLHQARALVLVRKPTADPHRSIDTRAVPHASPRLACEARARALRQGMAGTADGRHGDQRDRPCVCACACARARVSAGKQAQRRRSSRALTWSAR
jgi:hypothetical protein